MIGHLAPRVRAQVLIERADGLGEPPLLDALLANQELGIGPDRVLGRAGQLGEHGIGVRRSPRGPISQGQVVTPGRNRCRARA